MAKSDEVKKMENNLTKMFAQLQAFSDNPALDESYNPPPKVDPEPKLGLRDSPKEEEVIDLGPPDKIVRRKLNVRMSPEFKDIPGNYGFGPKGNIFASSPEQLEEYRRMYGGHGSENAKAAQQLRDMGREGLVMKRARERVESGKAPPPLDKSFMKPPQPLFDISQLFGKGKGE